MENSANSCGGLRDRKRLKTRKAVTAAARSLTATHGLNGFTIEEVCEQVGISRRTFFNYFPSKEDAILGHHDDEHPDELVAGFLQGGGAPGAISPTLLDDLLQLSLDIWATKVNAESTEEFRQLMAVIKKEPQFMAKLIGVGKERQSAFAEVIAQREGVPPTHPVIAMAVAVFSIMAHRAHEEYFAPGNTRSFRELVIESAEALKFLFSQPLTTGYTPSSKDES
ncbi:TetR family transcriptional regulator [Pseudarthrobacter sp. J1738]|uniref:TetR family transcriptional regulator n=1 Tax=Pseudarthrobacter sp. J1738 TaxID=3420446 RepID=UPI003D29FC89